MAITDFADAQPRAWLLREAAEGQSGILPDQRLGPQLSRLFRRHPQNLGGLGAQGKISARRIKLVAVQIPVEREAGRDLGDGVLFGIGEEQPMENLAGGHVVPRDVLEHLVVAVDKSWACCGGARHELPEFVWQVLGSTVIMKTLDAAGVVSTAKLDDEADVGTGRWGRNYRIREFFPAMCEPQYVLSYPLFGRLGVCGKQLQIDLSHPQVVGYLKVVSDSAPQSAAVLVRRFLSGYVNAGPSWGPAPPGLELPSDGTEVGLALARLPR